MEREIERKTNEGEADEEQKLQVAEANKASQKRAGLPLPTKICGGLCINPSRSKHKQGTTRIK